MCKESPTYLQCHSGSAKGRVGPKSTKQDAVTKHRCGEGRVGFTQSQVSRCRSARRNNGRREVVQSPAGTVVEKIVEETRLGWSLLGPDGGSRFGGVACRRPRRAACSVQGASSYSSDAPPWSRRPQLASLPTKLGCWIPPRLVCTTPIKIHKTRSSLFFFHVSS